VVPAVLGACSDGGGDKMATPAAQAAGNGTRLSTLNDRTLGPAPNPSTNVLVTGVVIGAKDDYDETGDGKSMGSLYLQDLDADPKPYAGVATYGLSFTPPDLRVAAGDVVDVRSPYVEFTGPNSWPFPPGETLPQLQGGTVSLRFEYKPNPPRVVEVSDLYAYATGRRWLGMLVEVRDVSVVGQLTGDGKGRQNVAIKAASSDDYSTSVRVSNALLAIDKLELTFVNGMRFSAIRGIVQYFQTFSIAPRSGDDLVAASP
jgi:hypothetical protein